MKTTIKSGAFAVLLLVAFAGFATADESIDVWTRVYRTADSLAERFAVIRNVVQLDDRKGVPLLTEALQDLLLEKSSVAYATERDARYQFARLLLSSLGSFKAVEAAPLAYQALQEIADPLVKMDALIALGKMRATEYAEAIGLMLASLNLGPGSQPDASEKIAYGCIISLDKMRDPRGYLPVFYASAAWYSYRTKALAELILADFTDDPSDALISVIRGENIGLKQRALSYAAASTAPADRKALVAAAALAVGHGLQPLDTTQAISLGQLRTDAMNLLVTWGSKDAAVVPSLKRSLERGIDINEKVSAAFALGANGGDDATTTLSNALLSMSDAQKSGRVSDDNDRLALAIVKALGATRNKLAQPALSTVEFANWPSSVIRASKEALAGLR